MSAPGPWREALAGLREGLAQVGPGPFELRWRVEAAGQGWQAAGTPHVRIGGLGWGLGAAWRAEGGDASVLDAPGPFAARWFQLRFDRERAPGPGWASFGVARAWTPRLEWTSTEGLALRGSDGGDPAERTRCLALLDALERPAEPVARLAPWRPGREGAGSRRMWERGVEAALGRLGAEEGLEKVVLARRRLLTLPDAPTPAALYHALARRQATCRPYLAWWGRSCWLGATPELLFTRRGREVESMALAGTRPRGSSPAEDRRLGFELQESAKDRREQAVVARWLVDALGGMGARATIDGPDVRKLATLQHLESRIRATLPAEATDGDLLAALHPTPALCGAPREAAARALRVLETADRGLHGGVLGRRTADHAEALVTIRGARLAGRRLEIWSGAGLVAGSDPAREWEETAAKQAAVLSAWESA